MRSAPTCSTRSTAPCNQRTPRSGSNHDLIGKPPRPVSVVDHGGGARSSVARPARCDACHRRCVGQPLLVVGCRQQRLVDCVRAGLHGRRRCRRGPAATQPDGLAPDRGGAVAGGGERRLELCLLRLLQPPRQSAARRRGDAAEPVLRLRARAGAADRLAVPRRATRGALALAAAALPGDHRAGIRRHAGRRGLEPQPANSGRWQRRRGRTQTPERRQRVVSSA